MFVIVLCNKRLAEEINDENNRDEGSNIRHFADHPVSDDGNKEILNNESCCEHNWSKKHIAGSLGFKINNASYCEDIAQYLFILVCCQFIRCQQPAYNGLTLYKYAVFLTVAVPFYTDITVSLTFTIMTGHWKDLCNIMVRYWWESCCLLICHYLKKLFNDGIEQRKKLQTVTCRYYQSLCNTPLFPVMLRHCDLSRYPCLPITKFDSLDNLYNHVALWIVVFDNWLSDVVLLIRNPPTILTPIMFIFACLFPWFNDQLYHIEGFTGAGRQAGDRSGSNGTRSRNESSNQSGSAGSTTSSSRTGGTWRSGLAGAIGGSGSSSGGDDEDNNHWRWDLKPREPSWEEKDVEDINEDCSANNTTASNTSRASHKLTEPICYEFSLKCGDWLYMHGVTSPMMDMPLKGDELKHLPNSAKQL